MPSLEVYSLFSGSRGNCTYVKYGATELLIDAGCSARAIEASLNALGSTLSRISAVLVTHEHSDHVKGLEIISKKHHIPVYVPLLSYLHMNPTAELASCVHTLNAGDTLAIGELSGHCFRVPHDSAFCVGYRLQAGGHSLTCATDIGQLTRDLVNEFVSSEAVILESNHDPDLLLANPRYSDSVKERILSSHGHLSNAFAARFAAFLAENGTKYIMLAHLSAENNTPELALRTALDLLKTDSVSVCCALPRETVRLM